MAGVKEFKAEKEEVKEITSEELEKEIAAVTAKGSELQKYIYSEKGKAESFALRRLRMEQFNAYCALVECMQAQISILK